jgi:hypothetical protein
MALDDDKGKVVAAAQPAPAGPSGSAPGWVLALYLGGFVLVYIGERVLSGLEKGAGFVTLIGVLSVLAGTAFRFSPRFRSGGERRSIERLLAVLSVVGLVGLALYFASTSGGAERLGIAKLEDAARVKVIDLLTVAWISLVTIAVVPMVFAETALRPMRSSERPEFRRVRSAATAGFTLALAALYCSFFVYAAGGVESKADYSYFKTSRPSESTRKIAASLSEPVKVVAFYPDVNPVRREVEGYLKELASGIPKLEVKVQDRLLAPKLAKELRATQDGVIVLSRGGVTHSLTIGTELDPARAKLKTLDRDFQEQLLKLARSRKTAYLTVGHGELNDAPRAKSADNPDRNATVVRTLLQRQNYTVKDLGLGQGLAADIPDDADVVLVLGPTEPFSREEIASLKRYADRGGKLFVAVDSDGVTDRGADLVGRDETPAVPAPGTSAAPASAASVKPPAAPSAKPAGSAKAGSSAAPEAPPPPAVDVSSQVAFLDQLTEIAQVKFSGDVLANEKQHVRVRYNDSDRTRIVSSSFSSHASVSTLSRNAPRAAVVAFGAGSLDKLPGSNAKVDFTVRAPTGTFADKNRNFRQDSVDKQASFNLAAAVTRPVAPGAAPLEKKDEKKDEKKKDEKKAPPEMRAFVIADADALSDFIMKEVVGNQLVLVDGVRWLVGEESFMGEQNSEEDVKVEPTKQQDLAWFYATIFGAPVLVLAAGIVINRRSRRPQGGKA